MLIGGALGDIISCPRPATDERGFHLRLALAGLAIFAAGWFGSSLPPLFATSQFWTTSLSWFLMRTGVMCVLLALSWLWMQRPNASRWSPMLVFGRTSLFVYWIHVELVYGFFTRPLQHELTVPVVLVAYLVFATAILGAAVLWQRRSDRPWIPDYLKADALPAQS